MSSDVDITPILDDLAAGRIDAAEAKRRIEATGPEPVVEESDPAADAVSTEWPSHPSSPDSAVDDEVVEGEVVEEIVDESDLAGPSEETVDEPGEGFAGAYQSPNTARGPRTKINGIDKIVIKATARKVRIVADRNVKVAAAEDVHRTRRSGSILEIIGDKEFSGISGVVNLAKSLKNVDDVKALGVGQELSVRVNPDLLVDVEVVGGSIGITDVPHLGKIRLTAGVSTITGVRDIGDLVLQAGQASVSGLFTSGWSRLRCESGQMTVGINPESDVTVRAYAQLGRVSWDLDGLDHDGEALIGTGDAVLDVGVVMGFGSIRFGDLKPEENGES
ncbi:MAG: hypothetical protein LBM23_05945 [Propionibacteriaceae bacterium]|jgi:hypothetical protein|nr:hypothetical protein [Propionibacteriaceae bacterium]